MIVVVILLVLVAAGIGGVVLLSGDDDDGGGDEISANDTDGVSEDDSDLDVDLPTDDGSTDLPDTLPPTTAFESIPAEAAVHDCIAVDSAGYFLGTGSCNVGGTPYRVVEVVDYSSSCSNPGNYYISSGDYLLCLELNILYNYCYVFPEGTGWIQPSECELPGTVHVIDVVIGGVNGDACTTDYVWDFWYAFENPPMVVCVDEY